MKLSQLPALKEALLAHECDYATKDYTKKQDYLSLKKMCFQRIEEIQTLHKRVNRYLADINEYIGRLDKKHGLKVVVDNDKAAVVEKPAEVSMPQLGPTPMPKVETPKP